MKNTYLVGAIVCFLLFSCSKTEEDHSASIIGNWKCSSYTYQIHDNTDTTILVTEEINKEWKFTNGEHFYIEGQFMGTYNIEKVPAITRDSDTFFMDVLRLYYEIAEPAYPVDTKFYGMVLNNSSMHLSVTDAMFFEDEARVLPVEIKIDFDKTE